MKRDVTEWMEKTLYGSSMIRGIAEALQKIMNALFLNSPLKPLKTILNGTWLGHPLHPVITDVPVGAWTVAILFDLVALIFGVATLGLASGIAIGLGVLAALAAIVTGLMDWMDVDPPELAVGVTHGLINIIATVLFAISFLVLWSQNWTIGWADFIPALVGYLAVTVGAYIGGSLVFRQGVMINRDAYQHGPDKFVPVLRTDELPDNTPKRVDAKGRPVLLIRRGEDLYAIGAVCSHYGGPLEEGKLVDNQIECPWHSSRFALENGRVKAGPASAPVPQYETRINGRQIEVRERKA
ncbi:MAG: Rieske 2Fe-2S domain-containing protein [Chloroflexi bacterium]|nr:Rieske 2Fe-2S domain-containing protein [Chloroflexota bacterium]